MEQGRLLVDVNPIINTLQECLDKYPEEKETMGYRSFEAIIVALKNSEIVDAVEVVHCCNCEKHDCDGAIGYCNRWDRWTKMSDYCSYGERCKV